MACSRISWNGTWWWWGWWKLRGAAQGANLEITIPHIGIWILAAAIAGNAGGRIARSTLCAWASCTRWIDAVQPKHLRSTIVPEGHDKNHPSLKGFAHLFQATTNSKLIFVASCLLLRCAKICSDRVVRGAANVNLRCLNFYSILYVEATDFDKVACVCVIVSDELRDYCERFRGINRIVGTLSKKLLVSKPVSIQITTWTITETALATILFILTTFGSIE